MPMPLTPKSRLSSSPKLQDQWLDWVQYGIDMAMWSLPQKQPSRQQLEACKLIAHRGCHHVNGHRENTFAAFDAAVEAGSWGIEFDVRWTRDLVPVILHDADCQRAFGKAITVADLDFAELRAAVPEIPSLAEMVQRYGGQQHLMIEAKVLPWVDKPRQVKILQETLASLQPGKDYHWMCLDAEFLAGFDAVEKQYRILIAFFEFKEFGEIVLREDYAGLGGHYLLLHNALWKRFRAAGKQFGVGFPASKNALFRELNRDVEWVFTNDISQLGPLRTALLEKA